MKRITDEQARQVMINAGCVPIGPYPSSGLPWPGVCTKCSRQISPIYNNVKRGHAACVYCAGRKGDPEVALRLMREKQFEPSIPYPGTHKPWLGHCLVCGSSGAPQFANVQAGSGPCRKCSAAVVGQAARHDEDEAVEQMLRVNFLSSVPYRGIGYPWPGVCLTCGHPGSPSLGAVRQGQGACAFCGKNKVDPAIAVGRMLAADFRPSEPFPGGSHPWRGECLKCGRESSPKYHYVQSGSSPCPFCIEYGFNITKPTAFYVVKSDSIVKGGITNFPEQRLSAHAKQGLREQVALVKFKDGARPKEIEMAWLQLVVDFADNSVPKSLLRDGYTEAIFRDRRVDEATGAFIAKWVTRKS
jgi:hypothetical protein